MWRSLLFQNKILNDGVERLIRSGLVEIRHDLGMIAPTKEGVMDFNANWIFFGYTTSLRDCYLWHQVMFNGFNQLVPDFCRYRCYKVVVKVRNFLEAMQFRAAMLAGPQHLGDLIPMHGKVGIDERNYTDGHFNGFIYCDGLEDALEKYTATRKLVDNLIPTGPEIPIIIKRSCTEFERAHGPTDGPFWNASMEPGDSHLQHLIEDIFKTVQGSAIQPDWLQNRTIEKMRLWANTVGDKSWLEYFNTEDFQTMKAVTYHDKEDDMNDKRITPEKCTEI